MVNEDNRNQNWLERKAITWEAIVFSGGFFTLSLFTFIKNPWTGVGIATVGLFVIWTSIWNEIYKN